MASNSVNKEYSLRLSVKIEAASELDAERIASFFIKELPRMDNAIVTDYSLYNKSVKRVVKESKGD